MVDGLTKNCSNCKYHEFDYYVDDYYCANENAEDFENYTRAIDVCGEYEQIKEQK